MKGRKSIPDELKKLHGTDQKCRLSQGLHLEASQIQEITSPKNMKILKTKRAKEIFKNKANQLIAHNILTDLDFEQLAIYSVALDKCYEAMANLDEMVYEEPTKLATKLVKNPWVTVFKEMSEIVNRIGANFGFSPVDRQKIQTVAPKEEDPVQKFINENV